MTNPYLYNQIKEETRFNSLCINYNTIPDIIISIFNENKNNIFSLILKPEDYITKTDISFKIKEDEINLEKCELDFFEINKDVKALDNSIILGLKFLKLYYTIFDYQKKRIGFIKYNKLNKLDTNVKEKYTPPNKEIEFLANEWKQVYGR